MNPADMTEQREKPMTVGDLMVKLAEYHKGIPIIIEWEGQEIQLCEARIRLSDREGTPIVVFNGDHSAI